jgi:hypothetical protein
MSTKEPGVHFIDREEYDRLPRVNWSNLKLLDISPAHYRQALLTPWEDSDFKKLGRACHIAVYEPELFNSKCVVWHGKARRGVDWEKFVDEHPDDEILTEHQHETALAVGHAVRSSSMAKPYISGGQGEVTVLWDYAGDGFTVQCKSRLDFVAEAGALVDLKTVNRIGGAAPERFGDTCKSMKYRTQAAFYRRAYQLATGKLLPYVLIAAETMAPFAVQVYQLTPSQLEDGESHFKQLLDIYDGCRRRNVWPTYADEVMPLPDGWGSDDDSDLVAELGLTPAIGFGPT